MKKFFSPNIGRTGRILRALAALALLVAGIFLLRISWWAGALVLIAGVVGVFEAARGWCFLRACGVRTKL